jgi:hypothetical protein
LHGGNDEAELEDEMVDNPLTQAAKKQIAAEEGGDDSELDIDHKFEVEDDQDEDETPDEIDDEDEEAEEQDDEEPEEEEDEDYSTRVKKRIAREKRRSDRLQAQLSENEARLARLESRWEAEADEKKLSATREKIDQSLTDLRAQKREALEEGDTDKLLEIDEKIFDLRADLRNAETKAEEARRRLDESRRTGEVIDGIDLGKLTKEARSWIDDHPQFRTDEKFRRAVLAADQYLTAKGMNHQSKDYWQRLEREVSEDFPRYFKKKATVRRKPVSATAGSKGATVSEKSERARGKVRITAEDKRNMIRFGFDPQNRDHLREWAAAKLTS